jgi:microcin C transport system substrate-binding protein
MRLSRRSIIRSGLVAAVAPVLDRVGLPFAAPGIAQSAEWRHGISLFDDVKYPAGFKHFDYVNPNAPKSGVVRLASFGTFKLQPGGRRPQGPVGYWCRPHD